MSPSASGRRGRAAASAALALALAGCGLPERWDAAQDVHAFFAAVRADDRKAFEAHVDRPALRESLKANLRRAAGGDAGAILGALLSGKEVDQAADALITPEAFQVVWKRSGLPTDHAPGAAELTFVLQRVDDTHVCLPSGKAQRRRCAMTFENQGGVWRLVAVDAKVKFG
jgi:hypothetical protein